MKKSAILIMILAATFAAIANDNDTSSRKVIKSLKHSEDEMTRITISKPLLWIASWFMNDDESKEFKWILKSIRKIKVLVYEGDNLDKKNRLFNNASRMIDSNKYEDLVYINEGSSEVSVRIREKKGKIKEFFVLVNDDETFALVSIKGKLDMNKLKEVLKTLDLGQDDGIEL